ncbi:entry exclusion lipoprotein TrbK [Pseudomonas sp. PS02290]|uniref:entry exclusion lipoprotein TrbK n=1 Tax=Pseudomonas sp. PS02290 TaxID=2991430 RepID=UPI003FA7CD43
MVNTAQAKDDYEVNDANCTPEHLDSLPDDAARQKLADACFRSGSFEKTPPKSW